MIKVNTKHMVLITVSCCLALGAASAGAQAIPGEKLLEEAGRIQATTTSRLEAETRQFIGLWQETAHACEEVRHRLFGNVAAPCRAARAAIRRGTIQRFQSECFTSGMAEILAIPDLPGINRLDYVQRQALDNIVMAFENALFRLCSLNVNDTAFQAFASLHKEAQQSPIGNRFDTFGPADSMAWWGPGTDPIFDYGDNSFSTGTTPLPAILNNQ